MKYREFVKKVQHYSGFSDQESEKALHVVIRKLAGRLTADERKDFASQLPMELQETAMDAEELPRLNAEQMLEEICSEEDIDRPRAKKQLHAVWETLKDAVTPGQIKHMRTQLPDDLVATIH